MAIIRKAPNGELVSFPDGTTEQQIQEAFNSEQYQSAKTIDKPTEAGVLNDLPPALKNTARLILLQLHLMKRQEKQ